MRRFNDDSKVLFDNVEQDSDEWLKWRNQGIGSSDVALLMDSKPVFDRTVGTLWKQKIGYERAVAINNEHVKRGKEKEPIIRDKVNDMLGTRFIPQCVLRTDAEYLRASLDGWEPNKDVLLEIKAPSDKVFAKYIKNWKVPLNYYHQMQYQMLCTNVEYGIFAFWNEQYEEPFIIPVENDHELQLDIERRCALFWKAVETRTPVGWHENILRMFPARSTMFMVVCNSEQSEQIESMQLPIPVYHLPDAGKKEGKTCIQIVDIETFDAMPDILELKNRHKHHDIKIINLIQSPYGIIPDEVDLTNEGFLRHLKTLL